MSVFTRTDVTAVKLFKNLILTGIGSFVYIFDKESNKLLHRIQCLNGQKVYGFVPCKDNKNIIVFGGKQYAILCTNPPEDCVIQVRFETVICDDWLHSVVWFGDDKIALLTAHNVVQKWDITKQKLLSAFYSKDNSILYSGLLIPLENEILVLAGTVFSEVIINVYGEKPIQHLIGHKGVIFSISCDLEKELIITTSDDRSVRIWGPNTTVNLPHNTKEYWKTIQIVCKHEVYGHLARVMRSCITRNYVISVGEDAAICYWDHLGKLLKKNMSHQNGPIWSVDADGDSLVTGGGDSGVILHPLTVASDRGSNEILGFNSVPKKVVFTARRNIVVLNEDDELVYYDAHSKIKSVFGLKHESTYKFLSISSCKQIIAVSDMNGNLDIFAENCKDEAILQNIICTKLCINKILSMQWAGNRHIVFCSENGVITILASKGKDIEIYSNLILPSCKERWLTASAIDPATEVIVLGDRCGNIHIYNKNIKIPIKSFSKVHGRYGPTSIAVKNNEIITTGRDGKIKYFSINNNDKSLVKYMYSKDLEFPWIERFLDKEDTMICGFHERTFVVYDIKSNVKLLEIPCGGGHRSWDAIRYIDKLGHQYEEFITLMYIKNSEIHLNTFQLNKIVSKNIVKGSHSKEINCLIAYKIDLYEPTTFYISGGEDTTLRISSVNAELVFKDEIVFKHLSNVKTVKVYPLDDNKILLMSAGGRAQICVKILEFNLISDEKTVIPHEVVDYMVKGTDKERKGNKNWRNYSVDFDPETRVMDVDAFRDKDECVIYAGCSDALLRIFNFNCSNYAFKAIRHYNCHQTCILKVRCIKFCDKHLILTCTTRGEISYFDASKTDDTLQSFLKTETHKSGINCIDTKVISDKELLIATGGDDNAIHLNLLTIQDRNNLSSAKISHTWNTQKAHSSQITGIHILENVFISTSIDQRITLFAYEVKEGLSCEFLSQTFTDVADVQGMDVLDYSSNNITVCVYGKGMEVIKINRPR